MRFSGPRGVRAGLRRVALAPLVVMACTSNDGEARARPTRRACAGLREHVIELRLEQIVVDREAHRAALERVVDETFVDRCVDTMTPAQVTCGRAARDGVALAACTQPDVQPR